MALVVCSGLFHQPCYPLEQVVDIKRFLDKVIGAAGRHYTGQVGIGRHHNDRN